MGTLILLMFVKYRDIRAVVWGGLLARLLARGGLANPPPEDPQRAHRAPVDREYPGSRAGFHPAPHGASCAVYFANIGKRAVARPTP